MKLRLLLCGAILGLAGCVTQQNPFAISADAPYNYDMVPEPLADLSPAEVDRVYEGTAVGTTGSVNQTGISASGH